MRMGTRILILATAAVLGTSALVWAQLKDGPPGRRDTARAQWEFKAVFPQEISPARYRQVAVSELDFISRDGWELVSVTPYVYMNEERGPDGRKLVVTQTYPAYFFKRPRRE